MTQPTPQPESETPETRYNKQLGARIRKMRQHRGMSQQSLADLVGLSRVSIVNIEAGRTGVLAGDLFAYAKALVCFPEYLLTGEQPIK